MDLTDIADADPEFPEHDGLDNVDPRDVIRALIDHYEHLGLNDDEFQGNVDELLNYLNIAADWLVIVEKGPQR